jgi:hypothetical protein
MPLGPIALITVMFLIMRRAATGSSADIFQQRMP